MRMKWMLVGLGVIGMSIGLGTQWQASGSSRLLPFQGRLTDASGQVVSDGSRVVQFKLYNAPVGGQAVWNGEVQSLTVNGGMVSTLLGSKASLAGVDFNQDLYLEMTLDANGDGQITLADPPLLPRQAVLPSVFAVEAANSRNLAGYDWTPIFGTNSPTGFIPGAKIQPASVERDQIALGAVDDSRLAPASVFRGPTPNAFQVAWLRNPSVQENQFVPILYRQPIALTNFDLSVVSTGRPMLIGLVGAGRDSVEEPRSEVPFVFVRSDFPLHSPNFPDFTFEIVDVTDSNKSIVSAKFSSTRNTMIDFQRCSGVVSLSKGQHLLRVSLQLERVPEEDSTARDSVDFVRIGLGAFGL